MYLHDHSVKQYNKYRNTFPTEALCVEENV